MPQNYPTCVHNSSPERSSDLCGERTVPLILHKLTVTYICLQWVFAFIGFCYRSKAKAILIIFLDYEGVEHYEYAPKDRTTNKDMYLGILRRLCDAMRRKHSRFGANRSFSRYFEGSNAQRVGWRKLMPAWSYEFRSETFGTRVIFLCKTSCNVNY